MFPFSIVHKIDKVEKTNQAYIQALKGNLGGYYLKFMKRGSYELTLYNEPDLYNPVFQVTTEVEYSAQELRIIITNPWGTGLAAIMTLLILAPTLISYLKDGEFNYEPLFAIPLIWLVIPGLLFFNYIFIISVIKEIKKRIEKVNQTAQELA